jgi:GntR family transcriptional regulator / MocR family aminotransferase
MPEILDVCRGESVDELLDGSWLARYAWIGPAIRSAPMPNERTTSSLDLLVSLDRQARIPLRAQLEEQLRTAIRSGRLEQEMSLPSTRALARALGVTRGLIVECYTQLQAEGYLSARSGAGTQVAGGATVPQVPRDVVEEPTRPRFDFRPASPDPSLFPRRDWAAAWRDAIRQAPDVAFG